MIRMKKVRVIYDLDEALDSELSAAAAAVREPVSTYVRGAVAALFHDPTPIMTGSDTPELPGLFAASESSEAASV